MLAATAARTDGCGCSAKRALTRAGTEELAARLRAEPSLMISSINFGVRSLRRYRTVAPALHRAARVPPHRLSAPLGLGSPERLMAAVEGGVPPLG
ncbi:hypothetical protein ACIPJK_26580 [Streptomyces roseus]|uniref:hypothetical protein n=1 Tax=Streptomyces roseus TaxID=66430 RepID=UPI00380B9461